MIFQLVRASDNSIVIWHTDHGHIYGYTVCPDSDSLKPRFMHEAPDASGPARDFADAALRFATEQARMRQLIGGRVKQRRKAGCSAELA